MVVHCAIEVVHHSVMVDNATLVGKHFVVRFRRNDEVFALPVSPMDEVIAGRERVEGVVFTCRIERREVEHHVKVAHLYYLRVAGYCAVRVVRKDGIALIAFPFLHIVRESNANTLTLRMCLVLSRSVVEHHELVSELLFVHHVDRAFVLGHLLPPLRFLVVIRHYGLLVGFP